MQIVRENTLSSVLSSRYVEKTGIDRLPGAIRLWQLLLYAFLFCIKNPPF